MQALPPRVGHIYEDLTVLASKIYQGTFNGPVSVWVSAAGEVMASDGHEPLDLPVDSIVGAYAQGIGLQQIEDDLRTTLRARATGWIIDTDQAPGLPSARAADPA